MTTHHRATRCRITVAGPVQAGLLSTLRGRFELEEEIRDGDRTVLVVRDLDQAAQRALLTLLWDAGHVIRALTATHREEAP